MKRISVDFNAREANDDIFLPHPLSNYVAGERILLTDGEITVEAVVIEGEYESVVARIDRSTIVDIETDD